MAKSKLSKIISMVDSSNAEAPIERQFISDLNYSIEMTDSKVVHTPSKTFKPSSIGGCPRAMYYQLVGEKQDTEGRSSSNLVGICENGTDRHIRIQQAIDDMKKNKIDCEYIDVETFIRDRGLNHIEVKSKEGMETKCYCKDLNVSFLTDGIIKYKGKYYILEIKTMNSKKFFESKTVRPEHTAQGTLYCLLFHLDKVMYLYECRDTLDKKAFLYEVTDEMKQSLIDKMDSVNEAVRSNTPPSIPENKKCTYCNYMSSCRRDGG